MNSAITVGTFDGVHRGHLAVISRLLECAGTRDLRPLAVTFDRHPLELIAPQRAPAALMSTKRRDNLIEETGVTPVVLTFDERLRSMTARDWMEAMHRDYGARLMVVGYDNTFGCDGVNLDVSDYRDIGRGLGIEVVEAPVVNGVSSSAIRKAVAAGDVERAADMLTRPHRVFGKVVHGDALGRTLGWPTANVEPAPRICIPADGVYAALAILPSGKMLPAVVNIGTRPTVARSSSRRVEAHIIGYDGDLYGKHLSLMFYARLRPEMKFSSIDALRERIAADVEETKQIFSAKKSNF